MKSFQIYSKTRVLFGRESVMQLGNEIKRYGNRALLVSGSSQATRKIAEKIAAVLSEAGVNCKHFSGVIPNPTTDVVATGSRMAREFKAQMVIGIGGGSSMDSAKAIAVEAVHEGTILDYLFYTPGPTGKTLPIITVGTTAGTGSQVGPGAVITNTAKKDKTALWSDYLFPLLAIVDPDLTASMPPPVTSQTGFDAFCHGFEALMSNNGNPHSACLALDAIKRIVQYLPQAIADGGDMEARSQMAWADTLAGYAIAESGVTLPHGLGMQISGHCPHVSHGQSLAVTYPEFTRFTWENDIPHFAAVGRIFNPSLSSASDKDAAEQCCEEINAFLKKIDLWIGFSDLNVSKENLRKIADCGQVLGDYKNNPRIATIDEMYQILIASYTRS